MLVDLNVGKMVLSLAYVFDQMDYSAKVPGEVKQGLDMVGEFLTLLDNEGYVVMSKEDAQVLLETHKKWNQG